jgi:Single-strand binding protein family
LVVPCLIAAVSRCLGFVFEVLGLPFRLDGWRFFACHGSLPRSPGRARSQAPFPSLALGARPAFPGAFCRYKRNGPQSGRKEIEMLEIKEVTVEMVRDADEVQMHKKTGFLLDGFCKDVTSPGVRATFIPFKVYDPKLASKLATKVKAGNRLLVKAGEVNSRSYEGKGGKRYVTELVITDAKPAK